MNVFELTKRLVNISSLFEQEKEVGEFLASYLEELGYKIQKFEVSTNRFNVFATLNEKTKIILTTHLDTVPPFIECTEDENFLYGRGSCDAKGIVASMIFAGERLRKEGILDFGLLFVVGEETSSDGAKAFAKLGITCDYFINGEPTENKLAIGQKGVLMCSVHTKGKAGHSAYPETGENAIDKLLDILQEIRNENWGKSETFGNSTLNIGVLKGGRQGNVIPDFAQADICIRTTVEVAGMLEKLEKITQKNAELKIITSSSPQKLEEAEGFQKVVVAFGTDIPHLRTIGKPLLVGPGSILDAHTLHEKVGKQELLDAIEIYCKLTKNLLGL
ncbi:M20/M25/M40 family metallo-hydrolase [bacterium]|nr:M20/M25/M40 family metallo-hydrolase [bacterium]